MRFVAKCRQDTGKPLPTKGCYFDQGARPTRKNEIIDLYELGLDEAEISRETSHAQDSVGQYICDYVKQPIPIGQISPMINMQPSVVKAYVKLATRYHPERMPEQKKSAEVERRHMALSRI